MVKAKSISAQIWQQRWWILASLIALFFFVREFTPVSYRFVGDAAPVANHTVQPGDPITIYAQRCNNSPRTAEFRYARRLESINGGVWPLTSGIAFIEPGCDAVWTTIGLVPYELPLGQWRFRTSVTSTNWLGRQVFVTWYSEWFEVVT